MPFNGSDGTYTLSDTIAPSTLADATELQAILDDIATALTAAVAKSGESSMTGPLKHSSGSQSLPSWTFAADPDTGIYRIAANEIGVSCGDKTIIAITSAAITATVPISAPAINVTGTVSAAVAIIGAGTIRATTLDVTATLSVGGISLLTGALNVTATVSAASSIIGALLGGALVATQAQQETGTAVNVAVSPGRQQFHASACKMWAEYDSGGTRASSYNVSSVTDNGPGNLSPVYTVAMSSGAYGLQTSHLAAHSATAATTWTTQIISIATTGCNVVSARMSDFTQIDVTQVMVAGFGDQ